MSAPRNPAAYPLAFSDLVRAVATESLEITVPEPDPKRQIVLQQSFYAWRKALSLDDARSDELALAQSVKAIKVAGVGIRFLGVDTTEIASKITNAIAEARNHAKP